MSRSKQSVVVSRSYSPAADQCVRALMLLLKKPVSKGSGPAITVPDDAKGSKHDRAISILPENP